MVVARHHTGNRYVPGDEFIGTARIEAFKRRCHVDRVKVSIWLTPSESSKRRFDFLVEVVGPKSGASFVTRHLDDNARLKVLTLALAV